MPAPSVTSLLKTGLHYFYGELQFRDFSGGLNFRDAASQLAQNESPDDSNVTLDERGGVTKRLGYSKYNSVPFDETAVVLTTVGTPTFNVDSSCTINAVDIVAFTFPTTAGLLNPTQGWMAVRLRLPTSQTGADRPCLWWRTSALEIMAIDRLASSKNWRGRRWTGGAGNDVTILGTESDGDLVTLVLAWTATTLKLSVSGSAFTSVANTTIPAVLNSFYVGSDSVAVTYLTADFHWVALGTGTLTDANAAAIHARGNTDPSPSDLPGSCTFVWPATSTATWTARVLPVTGYYWPTGQNMITQVGTGLFKDTATTPFKTFTTNARCAMVDFTGVLYITHPIDGLFSYDGTTVTTLATGPKGNTIAAWQNKLWVSGDPSAKTRVYFSEAGDGTQWQRAQTTTVAALTLPVVSTTTATTAITLPTGTVTVASTAGFAADGSIYLGGQIVTYTGLTGITFTGCSGGSGTIAIGTIVEQALTVNSTNAFNVFAAGTIQVGGVAVAYKTAGPTTFAGVTGPAGTLGAGSSVTQGVLNYIDIREKDTEAVVCLAGASGVDVSGRPGLLAFKNRSTYRIYDSTSGAFQTLDPQIGAASPLAVVNGFQRTVAISEAGIYWTDGVGPMRPASDKLSPLFNPAQLNFSKLDLFCAGIKGDRMYFSVAKVNSTANDLMLEYHPLQGWIVANTNASSFYVTYGKNDQKLYTGSPTVNGQVYEQLRGGSDDGTAIASYWQSRWIEPTAGHPVRIVRARVNGRGAATINVLRDYELAATDALAFNVNASSSAIYDDAAAVYDAAGVVYGPGKYQSTQDFVQLGVYSAVALQIAETSTSSSVGQQILAGAAPEVGAWGLYGLDLSYVPLGLG